MKRLVLVVVVLVVLKLLFFYPSDSKTRVKLELVKTTLMKSGYDPSWVVISQSRSRFYNDILPNSSKNSYHLVGKAIDVFVFDINSDGIFDIRDIDLIKEACAEVEREHPDLRGAVGTYTSSGWLTSRMVHIDTRGYVKYYNY